MRKHSRLAVAFLLLLALLLGQGALAEGTLLEVLELYGMTGAEAEIFASMVAGMEGEIGELEIIEALEATKGSDGAQTLPGELAGSVYTDPVGFSFEVPDEWELMPAMLGDTYVLIGPQGDNGMAASITVAVEAKPGASFMTVSRETIDTQLAGALPNYQTIALEDFELQEVPARELACMYGEDDASMLMQYQTLFIKENKGFIITMTTPAEEAAHDTALETYDAFLTEFTVGLPPAGGNLTNG